MRAGKDYIGLGAGVLIVNDKNEVLLMHRGPGCKNEVGYWAQPGGAVEFHESVEDAVHREIAEELDVRVTLTAFLNCSDRRMMDTGERWYCVNYLGHIVDGTPKNNEPHKFTEIGWFPLDQLPSPIVEHTRDAIAEYIRRTP